MILVAGRWVTGRMATYTGEPAVCSLKPSEPMFEVQSASANPDLVEFIQQQLEREGDDELLAAYQKLVEEMLWGGKPEREAERLLRERVAAKQRDWGKGGGE